MDENLSQSDLIENDSTKKRIAIIGRWMPVHKGHKKFLVELAKNSNVEKIIIMIGSCYERSNTRYAITANEREKMIRAVMKREEIPEDKFEIIPISDYPTFDEWFKKVLKICEDKKITHFCTGNKEDILDIIEKNNIHIGMKIINPEENSDFPHHATEIRDMIINGEYDKLKDLIPDEVHPLLFKYTFKEIIAASNDRSINFIKGRQAVDIVFLVKDVNDGKLYTLAGNRPVDKEDFPGSIAFPGGSINEFETATNAAIRIFKEETGLEIVMIDNSLEPAIIQFKGVKKPSLEQMYVNGIYGSDDNEKNGTKGGSSQCFTIYLEGDIDEYKMLISPKDGLTDVRFYDVEKISKKQLAFEHNEMLTKAINMSEAYPRLHRSGDSHKSVRDTFVISFVGASGTGKSTAALGTAFKLKKMAKSVEYVEEFAKGLVYTDSLERYIPNQTYIIAEQYKKIYDLLGKVDYVISDAGLQISALHSSGEDEIEKLAWYLTGKINQFTILIERDPEKIKYEQDGRLEDEEESKLFGEKFEKYMKANNAQYVKVVGSDAAIEMALKVIEEREIQNSKS